MKISVLSCWNTPEERIEFIDEIRRKWGPEISAEFYDGSDYDSRWTFEGPAEKVKEIICEYFQICPKPMEFDELIRQIEIDAIVDGKNMAEDMAED